MSESKDRKPEAAARQSSDAHAAPLEAERPMISAGAPLADAAEQEGIAAALQPIRAPSVEERHLGQARDLAERGDVSGAIAVLRSVLAARPQDHRARHELADLLERRGDPEGALGELGRALEARPDDVELLCARAAILTTLKRFEKAEADLRRAAKLDDTSADVQLHLGILFCRRARWREAVAPLQRAAELRPRQVLAHYHLAEAYNQTDHLEDALTAYEVVVRLEPQNYRALKGIGVVLDRLGRPAEATLAHQRAREVQRR